MRSSSSISVRQLAKSAAKGGVGQCIRTTLPYIRSDVPVLIVFKALGFVVRACLVPAKSRDAVPALEEPQHSTEKCTDHKGVSCAKICAPKPCAGGQEALAHIVHNLEVGEGIHVPGFLLLHQTHSLPVLLSAQADKEALAHIVYNLEGGEAGEVDAQMVEALRPSIEEAEPIETQEMALDYIGKRGAQVGRPVVLSESYFNLGTEKEEGCGDGARLHQQARRPGGEPVCFVLWLWL